MSRVVALHSGPERLAKAARARLELRPEGVVGDRHFGRDSERAVLLVGTRSYRELALLGLPLAHGSLGENLVLDGVDGMVPGERLRVGGAVLEVTHACTVCATLTEVHPRLPKLAYGRRGVYARVVTGGTVALGDPVTRCAEVAEAQVA